MKKSFSLLEIIFTILLLALLYTIFIPKKQTNNFDDFINRMLIYMNYTRFQSLIDDKKDTQNELWAKKRWTIKFFRCRSDVGGIYYSIYSDKNLTGHVSIEDSLKDPLTNKNIYSSNYCEEKNENSKYVLLTKNFEITKVEVSCNSTNSLGQISFGNDGRVYSKLSNEINEEYEY